MIHFNYRLDEVRLKVFGTRPDFAYSYLWRPIHLRTDYTPSVDNRTDVLLILR